MVLIFLFNQQILVKFLEENQLQQKQVLVLQKHKESFSGRLPISFRDFCFGEIKRKAWIVRKKNPLTNWRLHTWSAFIHDPLLVSYAQVTKSRKEHVHQSVLKNLFFLKKKVKFKNSFFPNYVNWISCHLFLLRIQYFDQ